MRCRHCPHAASWHLGGWCCHVEFDADGDLVWCECEGYEPDDAA